jgi:GH43 family beta-xylosidase
VNPAAWQEPAPGFLGTSARNMLYGPGYQRFDMSLDKNFNMTYNEHHQLQIRFDAFNAFNHTNFGNPNTFLDGTSTPGRITGSDAPSGSANGGSRELQVAARYSF